MRRNAYIKLVARLLCILLVLWIIHSILLKRLDEMEEYEDPRQPQLREEEEAEAVLGGMIAAARGPVVLDDSGTYRIIESLVSGVRRSDNDVTLAFHASIESLSDLPDTIQQWQGPVTVAVFVPAELAGTAALRLLSLWLCGRASSLSLHLVLPANVSVPWPARPPARHALCGGRPAAARPLPYRLSAAYPNNLLRNVARRGASRLLLSLDVDMAPSAGLRGRLLRLADADRLWAAERTAVVLPLYELAAAASAPRDKTELVRLRRRWPALLRPFYGEPCPRCQAATDYERWEAAPPVPPLYDVGWVDPWEPVYVVRRDAPRYDERFRQFGFNRISHSCELHVAGFAFRVLADGFVLHRGLKSRRPARPEQADEQEANRLLFRQMKRELKLKYPESTRRC